MSSVETVADALVQAWRQNLPVDATALERFVSSADEAYAVHDLVARECGWFDPDRPRHWKSGGASRSAVLTHAALPASRILASPADARAIHFNWHFIEAEIALRLARDVSAAEATSLSHEEAFALVDAMTVSIEIVDSRWQQARQAPALLKLADLQSHGALVLGPWQPFSPRDWSRQVCTVRIGDATAMKFEGTHSLGDPGWLLPAWLRHASRHGETVHRGTVVTTGTWCGLLDARKGDLVQVRFEEIGEAQVQL
jgi:2-keto-4-pentenoate hydratase